MAKAKKETDALVADLLPEDLVDYVEPPETVVEVSAAQVPHPEPEEPAKPKVYLWFFVAECRNGSIIRKVSGAIRCPMPKNPSDYQVMERMAKESMIPQNRVDFTPIKWEQFDG